MRVKVRCQWLAEWVDATVVDDPPMLTRPSWAAARVQIDGDPCTYWFAAKDMVLA